MGTVLVLTANPTMERAVSGMLLAAKLTVFAEEAWQI